MLFRSPGIVKVSNGDVYVGNKAGKVKTYIIKAGAYAAGVIPMKHIYFPAKYLGDRCKLKIEFVDKGE